MAESDVAPPRQKRERVEGIVESLDCSAEVARLSVLVGQNTITFALAEPDKIILKHEGSATFDFSCGPQKPLPISIEYVPVENPGAQGVAGAVRQIEF